MRACQPSSDIDGFVEKWNQPDNWTLRDPRPQRSVTCLFLAILPIVRRTRLSMVSLRPIWSRLVLFSLVFGTLFLPSVIPRTDLYLVQESCSCSFGFIADLEELY